MLSNRNRQSTRTSNKIEGRYANYFKIGHNAFEFVVDFGQQYGEGEREKLHTRIITNPIYAKALLGTLKESIECYEKKFGEIEKQ